MARESDLDGGLSTIGLSLGVSLDTGKRDRSTIYNPNLSQVNSFRELPSAVVSIFHDNNLIVGRIFDLGNRRVYEKPKKQQS